MKRYLAPIVMLLAACGDHTDNYYTTPEQAAAPAPVVAKPVTDKPVAPVVPAPVDPACARQVPCSDNGVGPQDNPAEASRQ